MHIVCKDTSKYGFHNRPVKCFDRFPNGSSCRSKYFLNRLINDWNALPAVVVNVNSVNNFKSLLT